MRMLFPLIGRLKYFALQHQKTEKVQALKNERLVLTEFRFLGLTFVRSLFRHGWIGSRVVACWTQAQRARVKSQSRRCRVTVLGKLFTPIVPMFTKHQNW